MKIDYSKLDNWFYQMGVNIITVDSKKINNKEIHKKNKKNTTITNKSIQKNHTISSGPSENIIKYEKNQEKLLSLCDFKPPIDQIVKYLKLMHKLLCKELGSLCKQEIIEKIVNDAAAALGLSKEQIRRLLLEEDISNGFRRI
jgi:hypothetical protein